jgi:hypothetical protein
MGFSPVFLRLAFNRHVSPGESLFHQLNFDVQFVRVDGIFYE